MKITSEPKRGGNKLVLTVPPTSKPVDHEPRPAIEIGTEARPHLWGAQRGRLLDRAQSETGFVDEPDPWHAHRVVGMRVEMGHALLKVRREQAVIARGPREQPAARLLQTTIEVRAGTGVRFEPQVPDTRMAQANSRAACSVSSVDALSHITSSKSPNDCRQIDTRHSTKYGMPLRTGRPTETGGAAGLTANQGTRVCSLRLQDHSYECHDMA